MVLIDFVLLLQGHRRPGEVQKHREKLLPQHGRSAACLRHHESQLVPKPDRLAAGRQTKSGLPKRRVRLRGHQKRPEQTATSEDRGGQAVR